MIKLRDLLFETVISTDKFRNKFKSSYETLRGDLEFFFASWFELAFSAVDYNFKKHSEERIIEIDKIYPTQSTIESDYVDIKMNLTKNDPVEVYHYNSRYYLRDGHHRVYANILNGNNRIRAFVFDLDGNKTMKDIFENEFLNAKNL